MAYITTAEAKTYIGGISGTGDDALIADLISAAQAYIERYTDRDFEVPSDSTETFDALRDVEGLTLFLDDLDLCAITSITNGDSVAVSSSEYTTEPRRQTPYYGIRLLTSAGKVWTWSTDPEDAISIVGRWGYSTSPPEDIKQACRDIVKIMYRSRDANADTFITGGGVVIAPNRIPNTTKQILDMYRRY